MPQRKVIFAENEVYHVFNRSIGNEGILTGKRGLKRFLDLSEYYQFDQKLRFSKFKSMNQLEQSGYLEKMKKRSRLVRIYAYALMPNHFHFLLRQVSRRGISSFISKLQNSYAKYFNLKKSRHGGVFQNSFKAKWVENDAQFIHLSRYIHLNPVTSYLVEFKGLKNCHLTSFPEYFGSSEKKIVDTDFLLKHFGSGGKYSEFVNDQVDYQRKLNLIKRQIFK